MRSFALPFLTLTDDAVLASPWHLRDDTGASVPIPKALDHWDYARNILLVRSFALERRKAAESLSMDADNLNLSLIVRIGTGAGSLPRVILESQVYALSSTGDETDVSLNIAGKRLSKRLTLESTIVLAGAMNGGPLTPRLAGSRLWRDVHDVELEGEEPRFPVETISFSQQFAGRVEESALWYLVWSPFALQLEFSGGVRLYLNRDNEEFIERMISGDFLTIRAVVSDVLSQMISAVIIQDGIEEFLPGYDKNTVGRQIIEWLKKSFPGQSIVAVREILTHRPALFHASIQASADLEGVLA